MTSRVTPHSALRPLEAVVRRLTALSALSDAERELLRGFPIRRERHLPGDLLLAEGALGGRRRFILAGWACRQRTLADGRRQIFSFLLPGDSIACVARTLPEASAVVALTAMETADAQPALDAAQAGDAPGLAYAFRALEALEQRLLLDHMVRLGRQTAYERVAHFLLELQRRLEIAGLGDDQRFPLPLTQEIMGDALGLSIVHVNRILQQLRRDRLIELRSGVAILLEPERLAEIAVFPPPQLRRASAAQSPGGLGDPAPA
ncbi:Crp/Fnr family transcriptional regulator [Phenylobacterium sp. LjRoot219]|uniref:Crp/Fnr family transcriptional regulator n=1 Tax=Phenylobacterium sp. LjRoot219 TaxID=3342283 RepID=UPI003ED0808C